MCSISCGADADAAATLLPLELLVVLIPAAVLPGCSYPLVVMVVVVVNKVPFRRPLVLLLALLRRSAPFWLGLPPSIVEPEKQGNR